MPTTLTRWDPTAEVASMRGLMDRLFEQSFGRFPAFRPTGEELGASTLGLDVFETNDGYVVKAAVPGVDPKDVDVSVEDDVLTIKGEFQQRDEANDEQYLRRELRYGSFQRSLRLPPTVDAERAEAQFEHGVLKLTLPKKPEARARSIKITPQGVVDGTATDGSTPNA
ncbi:MAG: Hsp20/alpha crystallin family protein [Dehalococcoidia bacterium]|nr:Hsp20/alpha crystallin family protein [Dehalococcoidia bacterium]